MKNTKIEAKKYDSPEEQAFDYIYNGFGWDLEHIELNKGNFKRFLEVLLPGKTITLVNQTCFYISTDTGTVLDTEVDTSKKIIQLMHKNITCVEDFKTIKSKYVYVHTIIKHEDHICLRYAEFNPGKKTVSFTIDENIYDRFLELSEKMAINKSKFIENRISDFVKANNV